jgi:23S rRNA pseudouridine1911/1915/1917 synthase
MNQGWSYQERVRRDLAGLTLLEYYTQQYRHSSREEWQARITAGQIWVEGKPGTPDTDLQPGQRLTYHRPPWQEPDVPLSFTILHEDADVLIIEKPSGLPVLPGGGFLEHTLLHQLQRQYPNETPLPIHRLGRGTSGLMLLARSPHARAHLSQQLRDRQIHKTYRALVGYSDLPDTFEITQAIGKIAYPALGYVYGATADGLDAHSIGQVLHRQADRTLLQITILTGRPHQIRIHLAAIGYPLLGDPLYTVGGIPKSIPPSINPTHKLPVPGDCGYHLHAHQLSFTHPRSQHPFNITAPPPAVLDCNT